MRSLFASLGLAAALLAVPTGASAQETIKPGPGRPRLGVVSREVSLLPRHWDWLELQPNGISAALRRLVEEARKRDPEEEQARLAREAASRFMTAMAGNLPDFEEASRALFGNDHERFEGLIREWPEDIRTHLVQLLRPRPSPPPLASADDATG